MSRSGSRTPPGDRADVYQQVTDRMIAELERGTVPWRKPWTSAGRPRSMSTGKAYRGINPWLLGMTAQERGYTSPWWGTFRQVQELGGQVCRGQNQASGTGSTKITLWKSFEPRDAEPDPETGRAREVVYARMIPVFNAAQCEGLPERYYPAPGEARAIEAPQAVMDAWLGSASAAALEHDVHGRAFYVPRTDTIHMPPMGEHRSPEHYYSTAFHEIAHSTGHASRLARPGITELGDDGHGFGSHPYGREELAAQMGASMLLADTGIGTDEVMENSAAYLGSWIATIREDPRIIIGAASDGQAIADLVMEPARQARQEPEEETGEPGPAPSAVRAAADRGADIEAG